jgi:hypothetical protein
MRFHEIVMSTHSGSDNRDASLADGGIDLSNTPSARRVQLEQVRPRLVFKFVLELALRHAPSTRAIWIKSAL